MKRLLLVLVVAAVFAPVALAKGPSQAAITGPGLGKPLSFTGNGESEGTALGYLTEYTGFFPAVFGQSPDPMLGGRPSGELGPKYTIHFVVPGGYGKRYRLTQDVYPYATGGAVTHMTAGQRIFDVDRSRGGWYRGGPALKAMLVRAGLPRPAPSSSGSNTAVMLGIGAPLAALVVAAAALVATRRVSRRRSEL
jgi:hypothetical protein